MQQKISIYLFIIYLSLAYPSGEVGVFYLFLWRVEAYRTYDLRSTLRRSKKKYLKNLQFFVIRKLLL